MSGPGAPGGRRLIDAADLPDRIDSRWSYCELGGTLLQAGWATRMEGDGWRVEVDQAGNLVATLFAPHRRARPLALVQRTDD